MDLACKDVYIRFAHGSNLWEVLVMEITLKKSLIALVVLFVSTQCLADGILPLNTETAQLQSINENYNASMQQLYAEAEREAAKINVTDRLLWIEFITGQETPYSDSFSLYTVGGGSGFLSYASTTTIDEDIVTSSLLLASASDSHAHKLSTLKMPQKYLQAALANGYSLQTFAVFLLSEESLSVFDNIAFSRSQNRGLRNQARALLRVAKRLQLEAQHITIERNNALDKLNRAQKEALIAVESKKSKPASAAAVGTISAISYNGDNSFCMIDGVEQMLKAGDTIENTKIEVVSINRKSVEFKLKRKTWDQKIGEEPSSAWK